MIDFFQRFGVDFAVENLTQIYSKCDRKQDASWDGLWMALGSIFAGFWASVGGQVAAKLAPKSKNDGSKTKPKNHQKSRDAVHPG